MPRLNRFGAMYETSPGALGLAPRVFLIAIGDGPEPPVRHRGDPLHAMQVLWVRPGDAMPFTDIDAMIGPVPVLPTPRQLARMCNPPAALAPREITGELLRDRQGRLYEKIGDQLRAVNQLFTGAYGEMIDLAPTAMRETPAQAHGASRPHAPGADQDVDENAFSDANADRSGAEMRPFRELVRRLVPEPGLWRLVRYADFIDLLTPQLAEPRRLQPGHELACYLQIYELTVTQAITVLEESASRELGKAGRLLPLSYDLCRRFSLSLPRPSLAVTATRPRSPGIVPAGARFITLRVALDPTADATRPSAPAEAPAPEPPSPSAAVIPAFKCSIPEDHMQPWELKLSREEAIYDMTLAASRGLWRRLLGRMRNRIPARAMQKWHALLRDKTADQQLWEIRPPPGAIVNPRVRRWVEQTLQLGGYDPARMLVEWEIYWRRKGL
jgi:hypothetical protein